MFPLVRSPQTLISVPTCNCQRTDHPNLTMKLFHLQHKPRPPPFMNGRIIMVRQPKPQASVLDGFPTFSQNTQDSSQLEMVVARQPLRTAYSDHTRLVLLPTSVGNDRPRACDLYQPLINNNWPSLQPPLRLPIDH